MDERTDREADAAEDQAPEGLPERPAEESTRGSKKGRRRNRRPGQSAKLERIAEVHYCRTDEEANQYLALGAEWDLQDIIPMRVETDDGGERDEVHFVVARWETDKDRARLRQRDRRFSARRKPD